MRTTWRLTSKCQRNRKRRKETDNSICDAPVRTKAKALCPGSDPFDGRMHRASKRTELLHAVMTSSGWEGARSPALAGRAIEGTLVQGAGGAEDTGPFHETVTASPGNDPSWAALPFLKLPVFIDREVIKLTWPQGALAASTQSHEGTGGFWMACSCHSRLHAGPERDTLTRHLWLSRQAWDVPVLTRNHEPGPLGSSRDPMLLLTGTNTLPRGSPHRPAAPSHGPSPI